jgi:hypothetical protein
MSGQAYLSPAAFKQSLESRLRNRASGGDRVSKVRQLVVFDRFMARVVSEFGDEVVLKGGLVLELRLARARTTKDVDLRVAGDPAQTIARLAEAGRQELGDFMRFLVEPDPKHPTIAGDSVRYEGLRLRVECQLAGKIYGQRFGVDLGFGDPMFGSPEVVVTPDYLGFAGIAPPAVRIYPAETHIAEKLHAYNLPRVRENSRVRDLPDLALLASVKPFDATSLRQAIGTTFEFRATHDVPTALPEPPVSWEPIYRAMAERDQLEWVELGDVFGAVGAFLAPLLGNPGLDETWSTKAGAWVPPEIAM